MSGRVKAHRGGEQPAKRHSREEGVHPVTARSKAIDGECLDQILSWLILDVGNDAKNEADVRYIELIEGRE